eukprot:GHVL01026638.1.p1 GENE.GHVL01026638.1~~GHVL01026638.1.p1  ORF type:complete len:190 (-),score=23.30 GHVL01026638.1:1533-2102(-)
MTFEKTSWRVSESHQGIEIAMRPIKVSEASVDSITGRIAVTSDAKSAMPQTKKTPKTHQKYIKFSNNERMTKRKECILSQEEIYPAVSLCTGDVGHVSYKPQRDKNISTSVPPMKQVQPLFCNRERTLLDENIILQPKIRHECSECNQDDVEFETTLDKQFVRTVCNPDYRGYVPLSMIQITKPLLEKK